MDFNDKIKACFYGGAIGDCMGGIFENSSYFNPALLNRPWIISDDTQLTLATIESIIEEGKAMPAKIAEKFVDWFNKRKITGIGSSTLKALQELQVGGHWALVGRQGEYAAGNGAAMRVAPLAFMRTDREVIKDVCRITHKNDEAYTGALAIVEGIKAAVAGDWDENNSLIPILINMLPDTRVRDRLIELNDEIISIPAIAEKYGNSGYVVHSVPMAIYASQQVFRIGFEGVLTEMARASGDTDTCCSMAGNLMGALIGYEGLPAGLLSRLRQVKEAKTIKSTIENFQQLLSRI